MFCKTPYNVAPGSRHCVVVAEERSLKKWRRCLFKMKPWYLQVLRGTFYNEKVDVFSLGVVMWELFSYTPTIAIVSGEGALLSPASFP